MSESIATQLRCRLCEKALEHTFCDLGKTPVSNALLKDLSSSAVEASYPLHAYVCTGCWLVQIGVFEQPEEIFNDSYAYFSSYSSTWLEHCRRFVKVAASRLDLHETSLVVELASNDGYLLQYFVEMGLPVLGIEPSLNVAEAARQKGVETECCFFGVETARRLIAQGKSADFLIGNNVLAHVPDIKDFVSGMQVILKSDGVISLEFPHLLELMQHCQFDTIYHEHFSYISLLAARTLFQQCSLEIFDVEKLPTHGGSLRIWAQHANGPRMIEKSVADVLDEEIRAGLNTVEAYMEFSKQAGEVRREFRELIFRLKKEGARIVGYGAAAKGNTLLNYCGLSTEEIDYVVDRNPFKQNKWLPGSHIPVLPPERINQTKPDYIIILPWNLEDEIMEQMSFVRSFGCQFITAIPFPKIS